MERFTVEYFEKEDHTKPAEEFVLSEEPKMQAKLFQLISLLERKGNMLREPYSKYLKDGIFEIRAKQGSDISRVLYFFVIGQKVILTNGFRKKTQRTPKNELELAKKYKAEYEQKEGY